MAHQTTVKKASDIKIDQLKVQRAKSTGKIAASMLRANKKSVVGSLGKSKSVTVSPKIDAGIVKKIKSLSVTYSFPASTIARILDVSPKTYSRYLDSAAGYSIQQKDRIDIIGSILDVGKRVLGDEEEVKQWLYRPVHSIENQRPIDIIDTESGRRRIENVLLQIEGGAY